MTISLPPAAHSIHPIHHMSDGAKGQGMFFHCETSAIVSMISSAVFSPPASHGVALSSIEASKRLAAYTAVDRHVKSECRVSNMLILSVILGKA